MNTRHKIALASAAARLIRAGRGMAGKPLRGIFRRGGIRWELDLTEGIDFSIYLLGAFEPRTMRAYRGVVPEGGVVLDIGANIGAHTLPLAALVGPAGRVHAFEPTDRSYRRLLGNIALNPALAMRIEPVQMLLVADVSAPLPEALPSSWPLSEAPGAHRHPVHGGAFHALTGAVPQRLDDWAVARGMNRLDFLKLDVDGYEPEVLEGGRGVLREFAPRIVMEFSPHVLEERGHDFGEMTRLLRDLKYGCRSLSGRRLPLDASLARRIPSGGSINVLLYR